MSTHETCSTSADPKHFGDNFIPIIPVDSLEHTTEHPFCWDNTCPCHQDDESIAQINTSFQNGLCTFIEAMRIINGEQIC